MKNLKKKKFFENIFGNWFKIFWRKFYLEILIWNFNWKIYLEILLGNLNWKIYLEILLGNLNWKFSLGILLANFTWKFYLEILLGYFGFTFWQYCNGNFSSKKKEITKTFPTQIYSKIIRKKNKFPKNATFYFLLFQFWSKYISEFLTSKNWNGRVFRILIRTIILFENKDRIEALFKFCFDFLKLRKINYF